ncbi:septum formation inhibitor Maf [Aeromicrobium camelliae]|uniref:Nucleoside triphosphate pyrophosphatase n=1 Tax=Aeromicrobium camelliae TaxID=1538144 RepID=A0A3N6W5E7_9ACTN|nr:Maf family protein [Aeromicrobium camelliae]RQN02730.1 septum formation inhibitor Maf [Aeromicrobium camelliae]
MRLILASASPARLSILRRAGIEPDVIVSGVDEDQVVAATPSGLASELARLKCDAVASGHRDRLVLGCDSVLEFDGQILGKPHDPETARQRWREMRGNAGVLHTGHCLRRGDDVVLRAAATRVHFAYVTDEEIDAYVATGEPLHVAGAFTIDGIGGAFVTRVEGDHHNVIGLSLPLLREMVQELGIVWPDLWNLNGHDANG